MRAYQRELAQEFPPQHRLPKDEGYAFCTWAWWGKKVRELGRELEALKLLNDRLVRHGLKRITRIIHDDSDKTHIGDNWDSNQAVEYLKQYIAQTQEAGAIFGLWDAIFLISPRSDYYKQLVREGKASDMLVLDPNPQTRENGSIVDPYYQFPIKQQVHPIDRSMGAKRSMKDQQFNEYCYVLDISVPEARKKIYRDLKRLYDLGVREFKLDFLKAVLGANLRNKDLTSAEYYRKVIKTIIRLCPEARFVGTTTSVGLSFDILDETRMSPDSIPAPEGLLANNVVGRLLSFIAHHGPLSKAALRVVESMNSGGYRDAQLYTIIWSQIFSLWGVRTDMLHKNAQKNRVDPEKLEKANKLLVHFLPGDVGITIGDALTDIYYNRLELWLEFLTELEQSKKEHKPVVSVEELIDLLGPHPLDEPMGTLERWIYDLFTPDSAKISQQGAVGVE